MRATVFLVRRRAGHRELRRWSRLAGTVCSPEDHLDALDAIGADATTRLFQDAGISDKLLLRHETHQMTVAGVYWSQRQESRGDVARRLTAFMITLAAPPIERPNWYLKSTSKKKALSLGFALDIPSIEERLMVHRRDVGGGEIPELGFHFSAFDGGSMSLSANVGAFSEYVGNRVVLSSSEKVTVLDDVAWRTVLAGLIDAFEPDHGAVATRESLDKSPHANAWDVGWLRYRREVGAIEEHLEYR
jgi:hypothetical protein